jgi:hypothetical protein
MRTLRFVALALAASAALSVTVAAAQVRGLVGAGLGVPVGDFASSDGRNAEAGGGTVMAGAEWLPAGRHLGVRVDGAWNRFCTASCDAAGANLDVHYRFLNANLNGVLELPVGGTALLPYLTAGIGVYDYKLEGDDAPAGLGSQTDVGANAGLGARYRISRVMLFVEGRFHNVFANNSDIQYIPVMVGATLDLR